MTNTPATPNWEPGTRIRRIDDPADIDDTAVVIGIHPNNKTWLVVDRGQGQYATVNPANWEPITAEHEVLYIHEYRVDGAGGVCRLATTISDPVAATTLPHIRTIRVDITNGTCTTTTQENN